MNVDEPEQGPAAVTEDAGEQPAEKKARKKGTCYVYAYAQNGVYKKIKVVVK